MELLRFDRSDRKYHIGVFAFYVKWAKVLEKIRLEDNQ